MTQYVKVRNSQVTMSMTSTSQDSSQDQGESCTSLLSILDDKNQAIAILQQQVHNQKIQIKYYLEKTLPKEELKKYSAKCLPDIQEKNIAISLELVRFCKQNNFPTKLHTLYNSIMATTKKIRNVSRLQERVLKEISKEMNPFKSKNDLKLLGNLMHLNSQLQKDMGVFKLSCNKLILIEDERNTIAEEFCALPASEKLSKKSLMLLSDEKLALQKELDELKETKIVQKKSEDTFEEDSPETLHAMLEIVNEEAAKILQSSLAQKEAFQKDLKRLNLENDSLKLKLRKLMDILRGKEDLAVKVKHMEQVCLQSIKEHVFTQKQQKQKWMKEMRCLKKQVEVLTLERDALKEKLSASSNIKPEMYILEKEVIRSKKFLEREKEIVKLEKERLKKDFELLKIAQTELEIKQECLEREQNNFIRSYEAFKDEKEKFEMQVEDYYAKTMENASNNKAIEDGLQEDYSLQNTCTQLITKLEKQEEVSEFILSQVKTLLLVIYILGRNLGTPIQTTTTTNNNNNVIIEETKDDKNVIKSLTKTTDWLHLQELASNPTTVNFVQCKKEETPKKYKTQATTKSTPALEQIQEIVSHYGDYSHTARTAKSEPFDNDSLSEESSKLESKEHSFVMETRHFNSETTSTMESNAFKVNIKESDLMRDCSNESIQRYFQNQNKKVVYTQIHSKSLLGFTKSAENNTNVNVSNKTQTSLVGEDKAVSNVACCLDKSVSSKLNQNDVSTDTIMQNCVAGTPTNKKLLQETLRNNKANGLPLTPLELLMEQETLPSNILQMNQNDLVEKLKFMSDKLDDNLNEYSSSTDVSLISNIRCVFDTLFSSKSVYASE